ncbi:MAG: group III truncated hemoglobin, partial [Polaromonas sp.]
MPNAELCTEEEITQMVYSFYDKVRHDEVLGPIFDRHVADWGAHLPTMVDFWSSALRGTARFR